jgi:AraC-like DNA-binding protein
MSQKCHSLLLGRKGAVLGEIASVSHDFRDKEAIPGHFHPEHQLVFASVGVMTVRTRQGIWVVPPMRAVWIPAQTPHSIVMSGAVSMRTLYFLPALVRRLPTKCFVLNVSSLLRELILHACTFAKLSRKLRKQKPIVDLIVDQLEAAQVAPLQLPHPSDPRALKIVRALLDDPGEQRTLERLCIDCGASKRTIERLFQVETNMTFGKWRQQLRLLHALRILASGEKVTAAALDVGYTSTSAFIAMFRKQLGTTPPRYFAADNGAASSALTRSG